MGRPRDRALAVLDAAAEWITNPPSRQLMAALFLHAMLSNSATVQGHGANRRTLARQAVDAADELLLELERTRAVLPLPPRPKGWPGKGA